MQVITLYRYERPEGDITISPVAPEANIGYTTKLRLIADEGKVLVKDGVTYPAVDTDTEAGWEEIDAPEDELKIDS